MSNTQTMTDGYIEAVYFTDTGDSEQPPRDAELTDLCKLHCHSACRDFYAAVTQELGIKPDDVDWRQAGIDLWLTRNGHGTGFWDRPEIYGSNAKVFSALAKAQGEHYSDFV